MKTLALGPSESFDQDRPRRFGRAVSLGLTFGILLAAAVMATHWVPKMIGIDYEVLRACAVRFWETGTPYAPWQFTGPYPLEGNTFIYPPTALLVIAPFAWLPAPAWWAVPMGVLLLALSRDRPRAWAWPLLALCVFWPRTVNAFMVGGSDLWVTAGIAIGLQRGWMWPLIPLLKPSVVPVALLGLGQGPWRLGMLAAVGAGLLTLPLWPQYVAVLQNMTPVSLAYSLPSLPMYAIPLLSWAARDGGVVDRALRARLAAATA